MNKKNRVIVINKSKSTGIILAVFFGLFAWLYTYKLDKNKFWFNLIGALITFGIWGFVAWIWAIVDMSVKDNDMYENYSKWTIK